MSKEFNNLIDTIGDIQEEIQADRERSTPIIQVQDYFEQIDQALDRVLDAPKQLSTKTIFNINSSFRSHVFVDIQHVRQFREYLRSDIIPTNLYYFLLDIMDDFDIDQPIVFWPKREIEIQELGDYFDERFEIERYEPDFHQKWRRDLNNYRCHIIGFPLSEMRNPMNFSLIVHECIHATGHPREREPSLGQKLYEEYATSLKEAFDDDIIEEVSLDILSLNYLGPIYALRVATLPQRLGYQDSDYHATLGTRIWYGIQYLEYIKQDDEWWESNHNIFEEIRRESLDELKGRLSSLSTDEQGRLDKFQQIQSGVERLFQDYDIPMCTEEISNLKKYLGMPEAGHYRISNKLDRYMLDPDRNKKIALPIKPNVLLNLLIDYDWTEVPELREPVLLSFKKWYVTRKTIYD